MISEDTLTRVVCHSFLILNLFYYLLNRYATNQMVQPHKVRPSQARRRDTHFSSSRWYVRSMERCWVNDADRTKRWVCSWWRWYLYSLFWIVMSTKAFIKSKWLEKEYREFARLREKKWYHGYYIERKAKLIREIANQ